jgi:hypothetical protein
VIGGVGYHALRGVWHLPLSPSLSSHTAALSLSPPVLRLLSLVPNLLPPPVHASFPQVPETIEGKQVVTLDMGLLVAGTKYRGEFEERLKKLMDEIKQSDDIILVRGGGGEEGGRRWGETMGERCVGGEHAWESGLNAGHSFGC